MLGFTVDGEDHVEHLITVVILCILLICSVALLQFLDNISSDI